MTEKKMIDNKGSWAVGGGLVAGLGAGFFVLQQSAFFFVGCMLVGLGVGLMVASLLARTGRG